MKNQNLIRRTYRFAMVNNLSGKLERLLKKENLSICDFSKLVVKLSDNYSNWPNVKIRILTLMNGRQISDTLVSVIYDTMDKITDNPKISKQILGKERIGWREINPGQTVESREIKFKQEDSIGCQYVARHMRLAMK